MEATHLLAVCGTAFTSVFALLGLLAIVMHAITLVFPVRQLRADPAIIAAISSTVAAIYPQARVTKIIEEES